MKSYFAYSSLLIILNAFVVKTPYSSDSFCFYLGFEVKVKNSYAQVIFFFFFPQRVLTPISVLPELVNI